MLPSIWFTEPLCWSNQHLSGRLFSESGIWPNIVWDSGEHKISWWDTGFACYSGSGTCQNLGRYWERKLYFGIEIYSSRTDIFDAGSRENRAGMRDQSPLLDPVSDLLNTKSTTHLAVRPALCMYVLASSGQSSWITQWTAGISKEH